MGVPRGSSGRGAQSEDGRFFLGLHPAVRQPAVGSVPTQFIVLGIVSVFLNTAADLVVAFAAGKVRDGARPSSHAHPANPESIRWRHPGIGAGTSPCQAPCCLRPCLCGSLAVRH
jgi:hypothetical protein